MSINTLHKGDDNDDNDNNNNIIIIIIIIIIITCQQNHSHADEDGSTNNSQNVSCNKPISDAYVTHKYSVGNQQTSHRRTWSLTSRVGN